MKLTIVLLTAGFLNVSAKGLSQDVTFSGQNVPLSSVFLSVKHQTGYVFVYTDLVIKSSKPVSVHANNVPLQQFLSDVFKNEPLVFEISGKNIFVSRRPDSDHRSVSSGPSDLLKDTLMDVKGRVVNEKGEPIARASVIVKSDKTRGTSTDDNGYFTIKGVEANTSLVISGVSIESIEVKVNGMSDFGVVVVKPAISRLDEVEVTVNTGYQQIPKERSTGSFAVVNNKELNRRVSPSVINRLEGITSGLVFYRNSKTDQPTLNIRGRSTIYANVTPLIILDNFPYDGDLNLINPNDIESVTILKDAAAASIYGVRAANGVIVLTSKKAAANQALRIQFNSSVTVTNKPNLHYLPRLGSTDFIQSEREFFNRGWYAGQEASAVKVPLTPAVELMIKQRDGLMSAADVDNALAALGSVDVLSEYEKYFLQREVLAQSALSFSGGNEKSRYYLSLGYDNDLSGFVRNNSRRYTVTASDVFTPVKRLEISTSLVYSYSRFSSNSPGVNDFIVNAGRKYYPYAKLADDNGNPLAITYGYRDSYKAQREALGSLDWSYRPLDELKLANNVTSLHYMRFNGGVKYNVFNDLSIEAKYQFEKQLRRNDNLMAQNSYTVRNMVNQYYNPTGTVKYPVPLGAILDNSIAEIETQVGRIQANYSKISGKNVISAIAGFEVRQFTTNSNQSRLYGYDPATLTSQPVDYTTRFATNPLGTLTAVPYPKTVTSTVDRFLSYFSNASYTYDRRYTVSVSGRIDNTNYFGIRANQRAVPLWSTGFKWDITREKFFHVSWIENLALRATYGFNGNINKDLTAYTTVRYGTDGYTLASNATVVNPPNPDLRWEKIGMANFGLDFAFNKIASGSLEYFRKNGKDIIGDAVMDPTTGITSFRGNLASIRGKGVDVTLNLNWIRRSFSWTTGILFSYATDKVYDYSRAFVAASLIQQGSGDASTLAPLNGRPVLSFYSYRWGGLDPATGDPVGYADGKPTKVYGDIITKTTVPDLVYNGPVNPPFFGSFRNDFSWKKLSLSVNITYKFGYYFRRPSVDFGYMFNFWTGSPDYLKRWTKPGDEAFTTVPSIPSTVPGNLFTRDNLFYANTEILVQKADNIRLQDISLGYDISTRGLSMFKGLRVYAYVNNLGIIWRANRYGIDPDALPNSDAKFLPQPTSFALGFKADF